MALNQRYISLAKTLHPRLTRFFARYPPPALLQNATPAAAATSQSRDAAPVTIAPNTSSNDANAKQEEMISAEASYKSPFRFYRNPESGCWHDPVYSLRRQAELVKLAKQHGVEELLPFTVKGTEEKLRRREENGLRVKGTGVGQKVKGKHWERTMKGRYVIAWQHLFLRPYFCSLPPPLSGSQVHEM